MAYPIKVREKTIKLRQKGLSLNEIHTQSKVSKGILSLWLKNVSLSPNAKKRLLQNITKGQFNAAQRKKEKTLAQQKIYNKESSCILDLINLDKNFALILCSLIYWCEGAKNPSRGIDFTNSDPKLIKTFLRLLRMSFDLDEKKFHAVIHLHSYHDINVQIHFWSEITNISFNQFTKPFFKKNSGKRIRENYQGCISVRYGDARISRRLLSMAEVFMLRFQ